MAEANAVLDVTYKAAADLSDYQYHFVYLSAANTVNVSGANARAIGVLQNVPDTAGMAARVRIIGMTKLMAGEAFAVGKMLTSKSDGHAEIADAADEWVAALALEAAANDGDIITAKIVAFTAHASDA